METSTETIREGRQVKMCYLCSKEFVPNKYRPSQQACSNETCQHQRQIDNMKRWRSMNPDYFKKEKR